ncbi:unnamed protein product [Prunus armeniaca]
MVKLPVLKVVKFPILRVPNPFLGRQASGLRNRGGLRLKLRDAIPTVLVNLGWGMRSIPWWGDLEKSRLGRLRMKVAFAFVRSKLCRGTMTGDNWLHSWYEGGRSSPSSSQHRHEGSPLQPGGAHRQKASFRRTRNEGYDVSRLASLGIAECEG